MLSINYDLNYLIERKKKSQIFNCICQHLICNYAEIKITCAISHATQRQFCKLRKAVVNKKNKNLFKETTENLVILNDGRILVK